MVIEHYQLSPKELADKCNVQRSAISHLINGRNRPSVSFLSTLSDAYPELDTRWLLHGKGKMFTSVSNSVVPSEKSVDRGLESTEETSVNDTYVTRLEKGQCISTVVQNNQIRVDSAESKKIERVIVCYTDGTFTTYSH